MGPTIQVRLPDELKAALQARADAEGRTLSNLIRRILEQAMKELLTRNPRPEHS